MKSQQTGVERMLREAGVRCTRRRVEIGRLLLEGPSRHVTAEALWKEAQAAGISVSLATIYNTLNELKDAGLVSASCLQSDRTIFDTNTRPHHHAVDLTTGDIYDLPMDAITLKEGALPPGAEVESVQMIVQVRTRP